MTNIPKNKTYLSIGYIIISALIVLIIFLIYNKPKGGFNYTNLHPGQFSDKDIIAPFNFNIYKNNMELSKEQAEAAANIIPVYSISEDVIFNIQRNIDSFFEQYDYLSKLNLDNKGKVEQMRKNGYNISPNVIKMLDELNNIGKIRNILKQAFAQVSEKGIVNKIEDKTIYLKRGGKTTLTNLNELYDIHKAKAEIVKICVKFTNNPKLSPLFANMSDMFLSYDVVFDKKETGKLKEKAIENVSLIKGKVLKDDKIIGKDEIITNEVYDKLRSLEIEREKCISGTNNIIFTIIGEFLYILLCFFILYTLLYFIKPDYIQKLSILRFLLISAVVIIGVSISLKSTNISIYILPFGLPIILIAVLLDIPTALIFAFANSFLLAGVLNWNFLTVFIIIVSGSSAILALKDVRSFKDFYSTGLYMIIMLAVSLLIVGLIRMEAIGSIAQNFGWGVLGILISILSAMALVRPIENTLPVISNFHLLELADFNHSLLKQLSEKAPGTYQHVLQVSHIAEASAKAINANPLLTRVGSYYHDIGKIENAQYFTENNPDSAVLHNEISSKESANIIKTHISNGLKLAKQYRLPKEIQDFIIQHHGDGLIYYFYKQAKDNNEQISFSDFTYDGPKPQTKESAIVMIADIIESTVKSLPDPTLEKIRNVIDTTIDQLIKNDQLTESGLSLKDIKEIKKSMFPVLKGIYQKRIEYPKQESVGRNA